MSTSVGHAAPALSGDALGAAEYRGGHMQIIASAGAGKTEVVSQRIAGLIAEGAPPEAIVAFTFTERAASELKMRIALRVEQRSGRSALDRLSGLFVGTIHAYCFRFLQQRVPRYETFDVLDDNQLTAFLTREAAHLGLKELHPSGRLYASIEAFGKGVDVVENELLDPATMPEPFAGVLAAYYETLERYRLLTYGQQVARTVHELETPTLAAEVHAELRHLIVDEYQDVNPAQERLIELLAGPDTHVCVVGDDDQAIYQWRGSDVANIVNFVNRYPNVARFTITANRRSRPQIIDEANTFGATIPARLPKTMEHARNAGAGSNPAVIAWAADDEAGEAGWIASLILDLADAGVRYREIAVLVRSRTAYAAIVDHLATFDIPVQPGGRSGLFDQPEGRALGHVFAFICDTEWRDGRGPSQVIGEAALMDDLARIFDLEPPRRASVRAFLQSWKAAVPATSRSANLVAEFYELLDELGVRSWDLTEAMTVNRLGTLARFSALLVDYESVRRRARPDAAAPGEQVGGQDRGTWYYRNLVLHIVNYAQGAYEGFDGEPDFALDAVDLTTIHRAKGLEWPAVLVPSLTAKRFPSSRTGKAQDWLVPRERFNAARYEGSDGDERRLFYVAMTRARDWLSISRHERVTKNKVAASPYFLELRHREIDPNAIRLPEVETGGAPDEDALSLTYSQLASFLDCGMAYRLRELVGFQPRMATELGYGKAVHHILRSVAEATRAGGAIPGEKEIDDLLDTNFFLPTANKPAHRQLRAAAKRLVLRYTSEHADDLHRIWETERPFELRLDGVTVTGRADVILDKEGGIPSALAIVDYKTSTSGEVSAHELQLQVYADAGRREGLDVRGAYVHDLKAANRLTIDVGTSAVVGAEGVVVEAASRLRAREYRPNPGKRCRSCEVRTVCGSAAP